MKPVAEALARQLGPNGKEKILYDYWLDDVTGRADLDDYLTNLYKNQSRLLVFFLCKEYESSTWCGIEWRVFKHLLKERQQDRLMLIRLDDADYQRLLSIDYAFPIQNLTPAEVAEKILGRWKGLQPRPVLPAINQLVEQARQQVHDRVLNECGTIKILGMPKPVPVDDLYIGVRILEKRSRDRALTQEQLAERKHLDPAQALGIEEPGERVEGLRVFDRSKKVMIFGGPGAGKTTFMKRLAVECAKGRFRHGLVPFFVELRQFARDETRPTLLDYFRSFGGAELESIFKQGRALVLLDGMDEVPDSAFPHIKQAIEDFERDYFDCMIAITCRNAARENRMNFQRFTEIAMANFELSQIRQFAENWFKAHEEPGKTVEFMNKLKANQPLMKLASEPLLLTLLCLVYQQGLSFETRADLYDRAVQTLLETWDNRRDHKRDWPEGVREVVRDLLSEIAYTRFVNTEHLFEQASLEAQIRKFCTRRNIGQAGGVDEAAVLASVQAHTGILVTRANAVYSFSHLTFQEYFTAQQIRNRADLAAKIGHTVGDPRWREVWLTHTAQISADTALLAMKDHVDSLLASEPSAQVLLDWCQRKSGQRDSYKPAALRGLFLYVARALDCALDCDLDGALDPLDELCLLIALDWDLDLARALDIYLARDLSLALDPDLTLTLDRDLVINVALALALGRTLRSSSPLFQIRKILGTTIELLKKREPGMAEALENLRSELPSTVGSAEVPEDTASLALLRAVLIRHRDIGHDWQLSPPFAMSAVTVYLTANRLLVQCLNSAVQRNRVTNETRQYIEDTLLLPVSGIAKIPKPNLDLDM